MNSDILIEAIIRSRKLDRLIGRLASWTLHPPADPTESGDIEAKARRELQALADLFQRSAEERENRAVEGGTVASDHSKPTKSLSLGEFSRINRRRCESEYGFGHKLSDWSLSDWMTATTGELGEAANIAKKINRHRDGIRGNTQKLEDLQRALADELADTFIYLDLLAQSQGIDLGSAVIAKFNRKSEDMGCPVRIPTGDEDDG